MYRYLVVAFALIMGSRLSAQRADSLALERRASQIVAMLGGATVRHDTIFAESFLSRMPPEQLGAIATQFAAFGHIEKVTMMVMPAPGTTTPFSARFQLTTDKGVVIPMTITLGDLAPRLVTGLDFQAAGSAKP